MMENSSYKPRFLLKTKGKAYVTDTDLQLQMHHKPDVKRLYSEYLSATAPSYVDVKAKNSTDDLNALDEQFASLQALAKELETAYQELISKKVKK